MTNKNKTQSKQGYLVHKSAMVCFTSLFSAYGNWRLWQGAQPPRCENAKTEWCLKIMRRHERSCSISSFNRKKKAIVLSLSLKYMKCKLLVMMHWLKEESHTFGYQRQLHSPVVGITLPGTYLTSASCGPHIVSERESSLYFISSMKSGDYLSSNDTWYVVLAGK